jgi:hypothetical protein
MNEKHNFSYIFYLQILFWDSFSLLNCTSISGAHSSVVVKVLCYKLEGRGFKTRLGECTFFFSIYLIFLAALGPGVHSVSSRNEYQNQKNNISGE